VCFCSWLNFGKEREEPVIPQISQEPLPEIVDTKRACGRPLRHLKRGQALPWRLVRRSPGTSPGHLDTSPPPFRGQAFQARVYQLTRFPGDSVRLDFLIKTKRISPSLGPGDGLRVCSVLGASVSVD
jgi:hypothetical protein